MIMETTKPSWVLMIQMSSFPCTGQPLFKWEKCPETPNIQMDNDQSYTTTELRPTDSIATSPGTKPRPLEKVSATFPIFVLTSNTGPTQKAKYAPETNHTRCASTSSCQRCPIRDYLEALLVCLVKDCLLSCLSLNLWQIQMVAVGDIARPI